MVDHSALEEYIRIFGNQMIDSLGHDRLVNFSNQIKETGHLPFPSKGTDSQPHLEWSMKDSMLELLSMDLGDTTFKATFSEAITMTHKTHWESRFKKDMKREITVQVWFYDDEAIRQALIEKLVGIQSFMREKEIFETIRATLAEVVKARPPHTSYEEHSFARNKVRIVVLGSRGVGKTALLYTLNLIQNLLAPSCNELAKKDLLELLVKQNSLVFNRQGGLEGTGTRTTREYTVLKDTFGETTDRKPESACLVVCDTPGMSLDPNDYDNQRKIMQVNTWDYVSSHIPVGEIEKISPLLVFRADKVTQAYQRAQGDDEQPKRLLLNYVDMLLGELDRRGASLEDVVLVGTHADKLRDTDEWEDFVEDVSERCDEPVASFLIHNFDDREFSLEKNDLRQLWKALRTAFVFDGSNTRKNRATPVQNAIRTILENIQAREHFWTSQKKDGMGLAELFNEHAMHITGKRDH